MGKLEIAKRLKEYREKTGLTVYQVGERLGKSGKTVSAWENGRGQPDADMFLALCEIYDVNSVGVFFGEHEKTHIPEINEPLFQSKRLEYIIKITGRADITELSAQTGVDVMTFTSWINGKAQPSREKVELLASFLGVTCDYLMGLTDDPKETVTKKENSLSAESLEIANLFNKLNPEGQEKATDYVRDLTLMPKYQKKGILIANNVEKSEFAEEIVGIVKDTVEKALFEAEAEKGEPSASPDSKDA